MADTPPRSLRDAPEVLRNGARTLAMLARVDAALLAQLVAWYVLDAATGVGIAWVGKRIIDAIVPGTRDAHAAMTWVAVELALVTVRSAGQQLLTRASVELRSRLGLAVNLAILEKSSRVAYERFEDPVFLNQLAQARREATARPVDVVTQLLNIARQVVTLAGFVALLAGLGWWSLAVLALTGALPFVAEARHGRALFEQQKARTTRNRQAFYLESVLTAEATAKEVKLFGVGRWLIDRYRAVHEEFHREEMALQWRRVRWAVGLGALGSVVFYGAYAWIVREALDGALTLGALTMYLLVLRQGQSAVQSALGSAARLYEDNLFLSNLFTFLETPDDEADDDAIWDEPAGPPPEVRFERVSFRYPGADRDALRDVSITIPGGETLALVGRNGAGKTTLVKLLVGLHKPTAGRIFIGGEDIATLSRPALRRRIAVLFQDFARFQFSAADNIGVGWLPQREDRDALDRAVRDAGAGLVLARLPKGIDTPLGRAFGGDDLSVGQWQRVALARAFMRRSRVLVLDEPTAAMDAEAEHEVFQRLRELQSDRTALLITHRFANVRMADRIVVFDEGAVVEEGTHEALLAQGGRYATMFNLQAEGYRDAPREAPRDAAAGLPDEGVST